MHLLIDLTMSRRLVLFMLLAAAAEGRRFPTIQQQQEFGLATAFNYYGGKVHRSGRNEILKRTQSEPEMLFGLGKLRAWRKKRKEQKAAEEAAPDPAPQEVDPVASQPEEEESGSDTPVAEVAEEEDADPFKIPEFEPVTEVTISTTGGVEKETYLDIEPFAMTYEPYIVGFTADSHKAFKMIGEKTIQASEVNKQGEVQETATIKTEVRESSGTMERRGGAPTEITIKVDPGASIGEFVAYLSFIPTEEKMFAKYFKITCNARP